MTTAPSSSAPCEPAHPAALLHSVMVCAVQRDGVRSLQQDTGWGFPTLRRELRQEKAKLLGFPTFAHLSMASKVRAALHPHR